MSSPRPQTVISEPVPGIVLVTIDRGERANAITPEITQAFWGALNTLIDRHRADIDAILRDYGVPLLPLTTESASP